MTNTEWLQFWDDMRESGFILVDAPARKIAVFGNTSGQIVIAIEDDGSRVLTTVCLDELSDLQGLLAHRSRLSRSTLPTKPSLRFGTPSE